MGKTASQKNFGLLVFFFVMMHSQLPCAAGQEPQSGTESQEPSSTASEAPNNASAVLPTTAASETGSVTDSASEQASFETISSDGENDEGEALSSTVAVGPAEDPTAEDPAPKGGESDSSSPQAPSGSESASWTDNIKFKGDLRYRVELIGKQDTDLRYRHRIRARAGVVADILQELQATVQVGTGESNDPVSNNQSLTESFSSKPLWLDLAYFNWHPSIFYNAHIIGGKMENPFYRVGKTELLWDPDLNPEGMAITYQDTFGVFEPFLNTGMFWLKEREEDDDSWFFGGQAGARVNLFDGKFYILLAGGYFDYMHLKGYPLLWDSEDAFGNSSDANEDSDGDGDLDTDLRYRYDYDLINASVEIGGKIVELPWAAFSDFVVNARADDNKIGWLAGVSLGKTKEACDIDFRYIYREVRSDATVGILTDSDFVGGGTNGKGHEFNFSLQLSKGAKTAITYFYNQKDLHDPNDFHRAQFDIKLKF